MPEPGRQDANRQIIGVPSGRWTWQRSTGAFTWDDAGKALFGWREGETAADTIRRILHPDDMAYAHKAQVPVMDRMGITRIITDQGLVRHILSRVVEVWPTSGEVERAEGTLIDITSAYDRSGRASEILESMTEAFISVDFEFRYTYLNKSARIVLGEPQHLLGKKVWQAFPEALGSIVQSELERCARENTGCQFEYYYEAFDFWAEVSVALLEDGFGMFIRDGSQRHRAEVQRDELIARLQYQANHDALTGLLTGPEIRRRTAALLAQSDTATVVMMFVDLDRFKLVNDMYGHAVGDSVLCTVGSRLAIVAGSGNIVAHSGGDEFILALPWATRGEADELASRLLSSLRSVIQVDEHEFYVSASIGLVEGAAGDDLEVLLRNADVAMYRAKDRGRDGAIWFDNTLRDEIVNRTFLERELRDAVGRQQIFLHYQPSYSIRTGAVTAVEALMRWRHPVRNMVPPDEFIPVAEESGLIIALGEWAIQTAVRQARQWALFPDLTVWVNVSMQQLIRPGLADVINRHLDLTGVPAHRFGLEITESMMAESDHTDRELERVRKLGVKLAIDDFGTGFSSLAHLLRFPADCIKIDRSFVSAIGRSKSESVVQGVVTLAHSMGSTVVAEGVETQEQWDYLRSVGCDSACGFLLARPQSASDLNLESLLPQPRVSSFGMG